MADQVTFDFTGRAGLQGSWPTGVPELNQLFIQHRYADARRLAVTALPAVAGPGSHFFLLASRVGDEPTRALRLGELDLLLADAASAAAQGREILAFVAAQKPTRYTAWYLALLESSGKLYGGDFPGALAAAKAAQDLMPRKRDAVQWAIARGWAARIYAWAGEQEAAAEMLEELATITPRPRTGDDHAGSALCRASGTQCPLSRAFCPARAADEVDPPRLSGGREAWALKLGGPSRAQRGHLSTIAA